MSNSDWKTVIATEVHVGDHIRTRDLELTVTRIDVGFAGRDDLHAFVEDSDRQWLKVPVAVDAEVELRTASRTDD